MAKLILASQMKILIENGKKYAKNPAFNPKPVVKIFNPEGAATWLLTDVDPQDNDIASGLCDLGMGEPEIGSVRISELETLKSKHLRLPMERDMYWTAEKTISEYADEARKAGRIIS